MTKREAIERLLAHRRWLDALARRLIRDPGAADDAVQATWMTALRRPPPDDTNPRGWLGRVLRSRLLDRIRAEKRRAGREQAAAQAQDPPGPEAAARRAELARMLSEEVAGLPEPYRQAIVLRFYDGISPARIARRTGVPGPTVRGRIHRGLALLRERLERRWGSDGRELQTRLVPLLLPLWRRSGLLPALTGGVLVNLKSALAAAVLLVLLIAGARFLTPASTPGEPAPGDRPALSSVPESPSEKPGSRVGADRELLAGTAEAPSGAKKEALTVTVVDEAGRPVKAAAVDVLDPFVFAVPPGAKRVARGTTDEDGRFEAPGGRREGLYVHVRSGRRAGLRKTGAGRELRVTVRRGRAISGRLVGTAGEAVAEGRVSVHRGRGFGSLAFRSRTDAAGRFHLGPLPFDWLDGEVFVHATGRDRVPAARPLTREEREGGEVEIVLPVAVSVRLAVQDERGEPVPDATVTPRYPGEPVLRSWPAPDERGRVELGGLPAGRWSLLVSSPRHATTRVDAIPGTGILDLGAVRLSQGGDVAGRVENGSGGPVAGAELHLLSDALGGEVSSGRSDGEGRFRLERVGAGSHELIALVEGFSGSAEGIRSGDSGVVVRLRALPGIRVELEDSSGSPVFANELAVVLLRRGEEAKRLTRRGSDPFREAVFRDLPPGVWDLEVRVDGASVARRSAFRIPDEGMARLRVVTP